MRIPVYTNNEPMVLGIKLRASQSKIPLRIRVCDAWKPNTNYTDRIGYISPDQGDKMFYVRMPRTPEAVVVQIYNPSAAEGPAADMPEGADPSFRLVRVSEKEPFSILPVDTHPEIYDSKNELIKCALDFVEEFSERAAILSAGDIGSVYKSDCGRFRIDYVNECKERRTHIMNPVTLQSVPNPNYGRPLATPARISRDRGIIEVAKKHFIKYSVPVRDAILFHEVSHFYINENPRDEEEADEHAIDMFIGRGYGYIDAENAFLGVFKGSPTDMNADRYKRLHTQIMDLEHKYNKYK